MQTHTLKDGYGLSWVVVWVSIIFNNNYSIYHFWLWGQVSYPYPWVVGLGKGMIICTQTHTHLIPSMKTHGSAIPTVPHYAHPIQSLWSLIVGGNVEALTRRVENNESPSHKNFQTQNAGITKLVDMQHVASLPASGPVTFAVSCGHHPCAPSLQKWTYNQKEKQLASTAWWGIQATWGTRLHTSARWSCTDTAEITTGGENQIQFEKQRKVEEGGEKIWGLNDVDVGRWEVKVLIWLWLSSQINKIWIRA